MSEVEQAIGQTAKLAKRLLADEKRADAAMHYVVLFNNASKMQSDARTFSSQKSEWAYSPSLARLALLPRAREDYYFDRAASIFASIMLDATGGISDPHLRSYICADLGVVKERNLGARQSGDR